MSNKTWVNGISGTWQTGSDWSQGTVPAAGDSVFITASGTYTVTDALTTTVSSIATAANATLDITGGTFTISSGTGSGTNAGTIKVEGGTTLDILPGTVTNTGTLNNAGFASLNNTTITGGTLTNSGTVDVTGGSVSTLTGVSFNNRTTSAGSLALDGNGFANKASSTTSASVTLTTVNANDVIILDIVQNGTAVGTVSDAAGLVWHQRAVTGAAGQTIYEYYAIAANALSADPITVNFAGTASYVDLNAFGISGANTSSPFDTNASDPATAASGAASITTSNANDLIVAGYRFGGTANPAAGAGWTAINASGSYYMSEYQVVSTTQAGLVATASTSDENGGIVDAIAQASASGPTTTGALTVDAGSTLNLNNTTINGGTLSNSGTVDVTGGATTTLNDTNVTDTSATLKVDSGSTLNLTNTTIIGGALINAGAVDITGGSTSILNGVSVSDAAASTSSLTLDGGGFFSGPGIDYPPIPLSGQLNSHAFVRVTTTNANDVIVLFISTDAAVVTNDGDDLSDQDNLAWHFVAQAGASSKDPRGSGIFEFYAVAPQALSSDVVNININGQASYVVMSAFGISGANTSAPFDPNASVPTTADSSTVSVTTSNANDFIFAGYRFASDATPGAGSGWTAINASGGNFLSEYYIASATQAGLVATASSADENGGIVDAVVQASGAAHTVTVDAGSTLGLNNSTITGGTLSDAGTVDVTGGGTSTLNGVTIGTSTIALDGNVFITELGNDLRLQTGSASVNLTTSKANDVIILEILQNGTTVGSVSDAAGLVWHQRAVAGTAPNTIYEYYAIAPSALSADAITVHFTGTPSYVDVNAFGISGANTLAPFDSNISVPSTPTASTGSVTTSNANDFIFAGYRFESNVVPGAGSGWTAINASGAYYLSEYQVVSASQAGLVATASSADENGGIVDAVVQASTSAATGALTIDAGSTLALENTTVNLSTLNNAGTVDVTGRSTSTLNGTNVTNASATVTVNEGAMLDLSGATVTGGTLTNSGTVNSTGISALTGVAVNNSGLVEATGGTLTVDPGALLNSGGTLEATTGGVLNLVGIIVTNTDGTIEVDTGSTLNLNNAAITNGVLSNSGTVDVTGGATSTLNGVSVANIGGTGPVAGSLALDGNGFANKASSTTSASVTLTTSKANDVIILDIVQNGTAVGTVSDAAGLVWHQRAVAGAAGQTIYEYYAIAANALSADAITVNFAGTASYVDLNAFGISGANTSSPFDTNASDPATAASGTASITTSNANDLIVAGYRFGGTANPTAGAGWTAVNASGSYYLSEYEVVSATQAGLVATAATSDENGGIVDAIVQAGSTTTSSTAAVTVDAGSTLDLNTTTITGGTLSNAGTVDVTGGGISTLSGVNVTNTGGTVTVTGSLALDGNGFANKASSTTSASVTLTTSKANDVIILDIVQNGTAVGTVSDAAGLVWHQRAVAGAAGQTIYEYYAIAANALSADAITVNFAGTASYVDLNAFGISGANTSSPFDTNASDPATAASGTASITTSNANDLIVAGYRFGGTANPTAGAGWTAVNASGSYYLSEYRVVSATQAGLVATAATSDENGGIVDAIVQAPAPAPTIPGGLTVDAGSTLNLNATTISGGTLNNSGTVDSTGTSALNGVAVTNSSLLEVTGGQLTINTAVTNNGNLLANGGTLDITGAVTGSGTATISGTGSVLEFGAASAESTTFSPGAVGVLKLDNASAFTGTVAGLATGDSIDLTNFLFSGSPIITGVTGTGNAGTTTNVAVQDGALNVTLLLLNQAANQFAVNLAAYTLTADNATPNHGTLFQLAAGQVS